MRLTMLQRHVIKLRRDLDHDCAVNRLSQAVTHRQHTVIRPNNRVFVAHHFQHVVAKLPRSAGREGHYRHLAADINQCTDMQRRNWLVQHTEQISVDRLSMYNRRGVRSSLVNRQMHLRFMRWLALAVDNIARQVQHEYILNRQLIIRVVVRRHQYVSIFRVTQAKIALRQWHQADARHLRCALYKLLFQVQ